MNFLLTKITLFKNNFINKILKFDLKMVDVKE